MRYTIYLFVATFSLLLVSCTTYRIPVSDFKPMFAGMILSRTVTTRSPFGGSVSYATYPINYIKCQDKKGNPKQLQNGPFIEMRITDTNNKRTIFYFDLIEVTDSSLNGGTSRIIPSLKKKMPLGAIKKIEVQNGGKKYQYIKVVN